MNTIKLELSVEQVKLIARLLNKEQNDLVKLETMYKLSSKLPLFAELIFQTKKLLSLLSSIESNMETK